MKAAACIEHQGVPIDTDMLAHLKAHWAAIQERLIGDVEAHYGIYEGRSFKLDRFAGWLARTGIPWPCHPSGRLDLSDDAFREMARVHPQVALLRELRLGDLAVGRDGRNRCLLSALRARTGRNQPSNAQFIFGPSVWLRCLIKPREGWGLAYIDWSQQEFGIAAALSGDPLMREAYSSGDPYLAFAKQAGAVPPEATKQSHKVEREQFKACVLAVQYGMGAEALAQRINQPVIRARELLRLHRETYRVFWAWSDAAVDHAMLRGHLWTVFGWAVHTGTEPNPRSLRNFPMQANGAEMLRLACCRVTEAGIRLCAPVHDAILIEAPLDELDAAVTTTQALMADASASVLAGFRLHSDVQLIRYPERYQDERGVAFWEKVQGILQQLQPHVSTDAQGHLRMGATQPAHGRTPVPSSYLSPSGHLQQ